MPRTDLHQRTIVIETRPAAAGALNLRAELRDVRHVDLPGYLGVEHPKGVVHHMVLEIELDPERVIRRVQPAMRTIPFEPSEKTRGEGCRQILPSYQQLVGVRIDAGYAQRLLEVVGGRCGCFHILSLAQCLPWAVRAANGGNLRRAMVVTATTDDARPLRMTGELRDEARGREVATATLEFGLGIPGFTIQEPVARFGGSPEGLSEGAGLDGLSITKGFTNLALERIGNGPAAEIVQALVIAITPVTAQASGALAGFLKLSPSQRLRGRSPQADSCHMWRTGGPLMSLT